jgi:hypothetical protein
VEEGGGGGAHVRSASGSQRHAARDLVVLEAPAAVLQGGRSGYGPVQQVK